MKAFQVGAMLMVAGLVLCMSGCASDCSQWQPEKNPRSATGVPGPGPFSFGNRVLYGQILKEADATWSALNQDVRLHMKANANLILTPEQKKAAAEGTRVLMGPKSAGTPTYAAIRSVPIYDSTGALTHDLCAEVKTGYAAVWGWRPYIRLQRISAAAEGTQIIGQSVSSAPNMVVERVYLLENDSGSEVKIRALHSGAIAATLTTPNTYVELTTVALGSGYATAAGPIQNIPTGDVFVNTVKGKMN